MPSKEQVDWWREGIEESRALIKESSNDELLELLRNPESQEEWFMNAVADESNARRKAARVAAGRTVWCFECLKHVTPEHEAGVHAHALP